VGKKRTQRSGAGTWGLEPKWQQEVPAALLSETLLHPSVLCYGFVQITTSLFPHTNLTAHDTTQAVVHHRRMCCGLFSFLRKDAAR
jgi:hypothetical protein